MIALKVKLNGELLALAGREDLCVLNTIVDAIGVLGSESTGTVAEKDRAHLSVHIGGLSAKTDDDPGQHLRWERHRPINIGDEISVQILEVDEADEPVLEKITPQEQNEQILKSQWESSREFYFKHKDKFENKDH